MTPQDATRWLGAKRVKSPQSSCDGLRSKDWSSETQRRQSKPKYSAATLPQSPILMGRRHRDTPSVHAVYLHVNDAQSVSLKQAMQNLQRVVLEVLMADGVVSVGP